TYEKAMRDRNRLLKDDIRDPRWYDALEAQMAEAGAAITQSRLTTIERLTQAQAQTDSPFPAADLSLMAPEGEDGAQGLEALRSAFAASRPRDMAAGRTLLGPHRADLHAVYQAKGVAASQSSTGEQKALLLSLILANARALIDNFGAPPFLLLDEVAAHLDASRRAALYDALCDLNAQAFLTGTGPELFDTLGDRAQVLEVTENDGKSHVQIST
ncbi:MAG: DNA replication and repair protein RecF, partial [Pseudomonadota bacterium]